MAILDALLQTPFVETLGHVLLHSVWQGISVALGLALALRILRQAPPVLRYNVAVLALASCVALPIATYGRLAAGGTTTAPAAPPVVTAPAYASQPPASPLIAPPTSTSAQERAGGSAALDTIPRPAASRRWRATIEPLLPWMVALWLLGVVVLSTRLALGLRVVRRLRTRFVEPIPAHVSAATRRIGMELGLPRPVDVRMSRVVDVPMVVGFFRPVVLLPTSILTGLSPHQVEMLIAHELAHVRRLDHLANLLQNAAEVLLFFNPATWWISNRIRQERECCCDLMAVRVCGGNRLAYARALATMDVIRPSSPLALAANGGSLVHRISRLARRPVSSPPNPGQWLAGLSLIVLSMLIASVATAQSQGGVLQIPFASMQQLDPYKSAAGGEIDAFSQIFDGLIIPSQEDYRPIPHLAESWESIDDRTWVFKLREGVTFQDGNAVFPEGAGREVTAEDVVYSIERFLDVSTAFTLGDIESVRALDRYHVEITTAAPDPFLLSDPNRLARVLIVPREAIEQLGEEGFARNPIGSGPFELVSFTPDQELELTRNEDYWLTPNLDGVEFVFIPDPTVQTIALEAGDVDAVSYIFNIDSVTQLSDNPDLQLLEGAGSYRGLGFNVTTPPFDEPAVRDAISKAMNIDAAVAAVVEPYGQRAYGQVPYWFEFEEDPELPGLWRYDPEAALAQLAEAGFTDSDGDGILDRDGEPLSFDIKTIPGSHVRVLTILVTQLQELGIDANLLQQDVAVWADDLQSGNDTGLFFDYSYASATGLHSLFHGDNIGLSNTHFYANPEVDALLDEASRTLDFETRNRLWLEAQRIIMADRVAIPLYFENGYAVVGDHVHDFVPGAAGLNLVSTENNVYLDE